MLKNKLLLVALAFIVSACSSTVTKNSNYASYSYNGTKYGNIVVKASDVLLKDTKKVARLQQLNLEAKIKNSLNGSNLFDANSKNTIQVTIDNIHVRSTFNAVMWGFMSGRDNLAGTIQLLPEGATQPQNEFEVSASYALGGAGGGQDYARLAWLGDNFAELTSKTIIGK